MSKTEFSLPATTKAITISSERLPALKPFKLPGDRLDSWKEIANHLGREVRTVQLWEKLEGLPVHRHFHRKLGSVFAFRSEVDAWRHSISRSKSGNDGDPSESWASIANAGPQRQKRIMVAVLPFESMGGPSDQNSSATA